MIFRGQAKKVTITFVVDADSSRQSCDALLAFLSPKDVCCLQVSLLDGTVEIRFLARLGKAYALMDVAGLIAP